MVQVISSFITGSRAYGKPREDSDIDLVVLLNPVDLKILYDCEPVDGTAKKMSEGNSDRDREMSGGSFNFGNLNIIAVTDEQMFEVWRKGTKTLKAHKRKTGKPVSREKATKYLRKKRAELREARSLKEESSGA